MKVCDNLWKSLIEHFVFYANVRQKVVIETKIAVGDKWKIQKLRRYQILLSLSKAAGHDKYFLELNWKWKAFYESESGDETKKLRWWKLRRVQLWHVTF